MSTSTYRTYTVPVDGGHLAVGAWGEEDAPLVIAVHGITGNHLSFAAVARALPEFRVIAPDLRGRGRSNRLPGPWGMARHAADVAAVVDSVGGPATLVGHSMGGFVVAEAARTYPALVAAVVLVDGGLPLRLPAGLDRQTAVTLSLGPALERLRMTFPSTAAYRDFWRAHPALSGNWNADVEAYIDYDLVGAEPELRSSVVADAVAADSAELFDASAGPVLGRFAGPARMLVATKGLLGQSPGLYPADQVASWRATSPGLMVETVPELNHYTLLLRPDGAARVAGEVRATRAT
jgi:pimeloyl-ACP methyl ester carboxylesterase